MHIKLLKKVKFSPKDNRMKKVGNVKNAIKHFKNNLNLRFLLRNRFRWMNNFINKNDKGIEVGAGAGFSKYFISNKNFKITDLANYAHLDYKNVDAQKTKFSSNSFNFIIAVNMIHHVPFPIKFFYEMNRILKKGGKLIIQEANCSIIFQLITSKFFQIFRVKMYIQNWYFDFIIETNKRFFFIVNFNKFDF